MKIRAALLVLITVILVAACASELKLTRVRERHYEVLPMGATESVVVEAAYCWSGWDWGHLHVQCYMEAWTDESGQVVARSGIVYRAEAASFRPLSEPEE